MKVSKNKLALYCAIYLVGLVILRNMDGWEAFGVLCIVVGVSRLSEIDGFRRGRRAAFTGDKE